LTVDQLPSALEHSDKILARILGKRIAIFLDYDGTLTPIVEDPDQALLPQETRDVLEGLARRCPVAIISGRDLSDVRRRVGLDSIFYAGSHGFELAGPHHWHSEHQEGARLLPQLDEAEQRLHQEIQIPGARVERKRFAIAIHYRLAREEDVPALAEVVARVRSQCPGLRQTVGKKIFELRPDIPWDKGQAVLWFLDQLGLNAPEVVPFYIGDDVTDEDVFQALQDRGIGIVVRDGPWATAARFALDGPGEVRRFLELLLAALTARPG